MGMNLLFELYLSWIFQREKSKIQGACRPVLVNVFSLFSRMFSWRMGMASMGLHSFFSATFITKSLNIRSDSWQLKCPS
ncbi:unnamed protein product [Larinioides sclopetarius]|uniref:Uncharacterized protein n=1 Tax=Larinioides sclopetarius TaxID=280406 RepID=A0AAV2BHZ4_9ARAC